MDPSSSTSQDKQVDDNHEAIKDWSQKEKYHLMLALKTVGRHDIKKIQEFVVTKTLAETKAAVDYYTGVAYHHPSLQKKLKLIRKPHTLAEWAKLLTDNLKDNELTTETATAVRMIADLEDIPQKELTEGIDFRQVYHEIANAMEGKPFSPNIEEGTIAVLQKCLIDTIKASDAFMKNSTLQYITDNIDLSENEINMFPRLAEDTEEATIRHLASQRSYNPLKIPEHYLKPEDSHDGKPGPSKKDTSSKEKPGPSKKDTSSDEKPGPSKKDTSSYEKPGPSKKDTSSDEKPGPSKKDTSSNEKPGPSKKDTSSNEKPGPSKKDTSSNEKPGPSKKDTSSNEKPGPSKKGTSSDKKPGPSKKDTSSDEKPGPSKKGTSSDKKPGPSKKGTSTDKKPGPNKKDASSDEKPGPNKKGTSSYEKPGPRKKDTSSHEKPGPSNKDNTSDEKPGPSKNPHT